MYDLPVHDLPVPTVALAIVTCPLGVLVGRRNDDKPPWTFIGGSVEPGESVFQTAIREVREETGLHVVPFFRPEIGRRVHPLGREVAYIACAPATDDYSIDVLDKEELAEVKWVSLREINKLIGYWYGPVYQYLSEVLPYDGA